MTLLRKQAITPSDQSLIEAVGQAVVSPVKDIKQEESDWEEFSRHFVDVLRASFSVNHFRSLGRTGSHSDLDGVRLESAKKLENKQPMIHTNY